MKEFKNLIDVKSIVTLTLLFALVFVVLFSVIKTGTIEEELFLLFSNVVTMVFTYFFTKKKQENTENRDI